MADTTLNQVVEQVKRLSWEDRLRLKAMLDDEQTDRNTVLPEDALDAQLLKMGLLIEIPSAMEDQALDKDFAPVKIVGKPVSEMIIEERR